MLRLKKKRTIRIKSPQIRKIRNELRILLQRAISSKLNELSDEESKLQQSNGFWDENHPSYETLHREMRKLTSQGNNLRYAYNASILKCPVCMRIDKDMTFNPILKKWYCVECYEDNKTFQIKQGHPELYP